MRIWAIFIFLFCWIAVFGQEKRTYVFDRVLVMDVKHYSFYEGRMLSFINSRDSTYNLTVRLGKSIKDAKLNDRKDRSIINFDIDFDFENPGDIGKLGTGTRHEIGWRKKPKRYKNFVEDVVIERDTAGKQLIIHAVQYKNKKRRKVLNENYYFFTHAPKAFNPHPRSSKNYYSEKYGVKFEDDENLTKILHLHDGKISSETKILSFISSEMTLTFDVKDPFKKNFKK